MLEYGLLGYLTPLIVQLGSYLHQIPLLLFGPVNSQLGFQDVTEFLSDLNVRTSAQNLVHFVPLSPAEILYKNDNFETLTE